MGKTQFNSAWATRMRSPSQQQGRHLALAIICTFVDVIDRNAFFIFFQAPQDSTYGLKMNLNIA
jgi:hypothetical protein